MKNMYKIKIVIIIGVMLLWFTSTIVSVNAITNSTSNVGVPLYRQIQGLFENPFFGPDYSCIFDAYQLHCIPGENQDCLKPQFGKNEDGTCFPKTNVNGTWKWECPEGYHGASDDETGQCYPDTEPCYPGEVRNQTDPNDRRCREETIVCNDKNYNATACVRIADYPDRYCLTNPDSDNCNVPSGGCPGVFVQMNSKNFTSPRCVPDDRDQLDLEERNRKKDDPNRCAIGYELDLISSAVAICKKKID